MNSIPYQRSVIVPTDDVIVRRQLRDLGEPMCFFGEGPGERRERLNKFLSKLSPEERQKLQANYATQSIQDRTQTQTFYYEGCEALKKTRYAIASFSIQQCNCRLDMARIEQLEPISTRLIPQQDLIEKIRKLELTVSRDNDEISTNELRTVTSCNLNTDSSILATSSRGGHCKLFSIPDLKTQMVYRSDRPNANFITFSPKSGAGLSPKVANLTSCYMDGSIKMWNLVDENPVCQLSGPQDWRVTRVRYHPIGEYLASCCSDKSWRLWDISTETEILHQEGHADAVFDIAFHCDGSLAGSAGMDAYARIWDLRTGKSIQILEGHTKGIRCIDFSPDGYHIATGSMDNTVKVWNLRQRQLEYTIPAHTNIVTSVMFEKEKGYYLASSSFDKTLRFWSSRTWAPIKTLDIQDETSNVGTNLEVNAYEGKVNKIDVSTGSDILVACHFRHINLWKVKQMN